MAKTVNKNVFYRMLLRVIVACSVIAQIYCSKFYRNYYIWFEREMKASIYHVLQIKDSERISGTIAIVGTVHELDYDEIVRYLSQFVEVNDLEAVFLIVFRVIINQD